MEVIIKPTPEEVAVFAADIFEPYINRGDTIGLATGSTPLALYKELIRRYEAGRLDFSGCTAFLLDEYIGLPREHEQSYYRFIRDNFTHHVNLDDAKVNSPDGLAEDTLEVGPAYDAAIDAAGGIAIQLLGVGANGHIGFNEPGSSLSSGTRRKTLHPQTIKDNARFFGDDESQVPVHVLTQGLGTISRSGHAVLLATGAAKAQAVKNMVEGPLSAYCPASVLQLHRKATVIIDDAAASMLEFKEYYQFCAEHRD